jgi:hypothetical protein
MTQSTSNLIPTSSADIVGIFDVNFNQLFSAARPVRASIKEASTFFAHPLEDSSSRVDHVIFNPIEIGFDLVMSGEDYRNTYQDVKQVYLDQTQLIVQTKTETYENMYIQSIPHNEEVGLFDAVAMSVTIVEAQIAATEITFVPQRAKDRSTANKGRVEGQSPSETQEQRGSVLSRVFK